MNTPYIVAVSGGVDSVVLLDVLSKQADREIVVAHFDHGIRPDSARDAQFVATLARRYGHAFETMREELGESASEELARDRRYRFLRNVARRHQGVIVTAHHADDVVETVAINLTRGTGWRGLAVLDSDVQRPLIDMTKRELIEYAKEYGLVWREDSTNASDAYLRNRLRRKMQEIDDDDKWQVRALRAQQAGIKREIDAEIHGLLGDGPSYERHMFIQVDTAVAYEMIRFISQALLTRPQQQRALHAIKTARSGAKYEAGSGVQFVFTSRNFTVQLLK